MAVRVSPHETKMSSSFSFTEQNFESSLILDVPFNFLLPLLRQDSQSRTAGVLVFLHSVSCTSSQRRGHLHAIFVKLKS